MDLLWKTSYATETSSCHSEHAEGNAKCEAKTKLHARKSYLFVCLFFSISQKPLNAFVFDCFLKPYFSYKIVNILVFNLGQSYFY